MNRVWVLGLLIIFLTVASFTANAVAAPSPDRPNVIIVLTDDQGYGDFSCHGNPILKTPNLDKLHAQSIRLTDFHVAPMCTPTRGQLISGRDCLANGAMNVSSGRTMLRRGLPTIAEIMSAGGYRCGHFGKWHLGDTYPYRPQDRGFHEAIFYPSSHIGSAPDFFTNHYFDDVYEHNGKREKYTGYTTDVFFREAMKWMKAQASQGKPFFCYIATAAPHGPYHVPENYRKMYEGIDVKNVTPQQRQNIIRFFGMIANIDDNMAKLDEFLHASNLLENTLLIFMTDNGGTGGVPVFNAGMRGKKIDLYEGGHRVPCFIRWPAGKLRPAGDVAELAEIQDVLPTITDLCGVNKPEGATFDGISLAALLRGQTDKLPERSLCIQFSRMNQPSPQKGDGAVMWKRWRLIQDNELYDLSTDFAQKNNVIEQHPDVVAKMRADYERWWAKVGPHVDEFSAITIGADAENPVQLSPADWQDSFLDQSNQIRSGLRRNGAWNVIVDRAGTYEIELRRWPREADAAIQAALPAQKHTDGQFPPGVALPIASAKLKIADFEQKLPIGAQDKSARFTCELKPGRAQLQTGFLDDSGKEVCGAYYVYIKRN